MPITKSAKKALRQSGRRRLQNLDRKDAYKKVIKEIKNFVAKAQGKEAQKILPQLYKALDKAVKTNVIKKNKASRLKSRISKSIAR